MSFEEKKIEEIEEMDDVLSSVRVMLNESEPVLELVRMVDKNGNVVELTHEDNFESRDSNLMKLIKDNGNLISIDCEQDVDDDDDIYDEDEDPDDSLCSVAESVVFRADVPVEDVEEVIEEDISVDALRSNFEYDVLRSSSQTVYNEYGDDLVNKLKDVLSPYIERAISECIESSLTKVLSRKHGDDK